MEVNEKKDNFKTRIKKIFAILLLILNWIIAIDFGLASILIFASSILAYPLQGLSYGLEAERSFILFFFGMYIEVLKFFIVPVIIFVFNCIFIKRNLK